ncbi:hypothetical protein [Bacillus sp. FJAT-45066]|uniref:hypothetical protein n=1 Tax=Bacillus sp. FJAT-45066 TaxID=2011010 RepID=UPI000BB87B00|nr:hypothetical protein [Bacillus sp. FJAT-45066]
MRINNRNQFSEDEFQKVLAQIIESNILISDSSDLEVKGNILEYSVSDEELLANIVAAGITPYQSVSEDNGEIGLERWVWEGRTSVSFHWWGVTIFLSRTAVQNLFGLKISAIAFMLGVMLPHPVIWALLVVAAEWLFTFLIQRIAHPIWLKVQLTGKKVDWGPQLP